jgi:hypothetical protein
MEIARAHGDSTNDAFLVLWKRLRFLCDGKPKNVSYVLTDYYKSRTGNLVNSRGLLNAWDSIIDTDINCKTLSDRERLENFKTLLVELDSFAEAWSPWFSKNTKQTRDYTDLIDMRVSHQYAAMMGALRSGAEKLESEEYLKIQKAILRSMEYVHIHQKLGGSLDSNALKSLHKDWMHLCYKASSSKFDESFDSALAEIRRQADLQKGELKGFQTALQYKPLSTSEARFLLRKAESLLTNGETKADDALWVEHICPQSWDNDPKPIGWTHIDWSEHYTLLDRLGNLTLLRKEPNIRASNKPWSEKKAIYNKESALMLNNSDNLTCHEHWNDSSIIARSNILAKVLWDKLTL